MSIHTFLNVSLAVLFPSAFLFVFLSVTLPIFISFLFSLPYW